MKKKKEFRLDKFIFYTNPPQYILGQPPFNIENELQ
jgi:hypothetical protein